MKQVFYIKGQNIFNRCKQNLAWKYTIMNLYIQETNYNEYLLGPNKSLHYGQVTSQYSIYPVHISVRTGFEDCYALYTHLWNEENMDPFYAGVWYCRFYHIVLILLFIFTLLLYLEIFVFSQVTVSKIVNRWVAVNNYICRSTVFAFYWLV